MGVFFSSNLAEPCQTHLNQFGIQHKQIQGSHQTFHTSPFLMVPPLTAFTYFQSLRLFLKVNKYIDSWQQVTNIGVFFFFF